MGKTVDVAKQSPEFAKVVTPLLSKLKGTLMEILPPNPNCIPECK